MDRKGAEAVERTWYRPILVGSSHSPIESVSSAEVPLAHVDVGAPTAEVAEHQFGFQNIVGESPALRTAIKLATQVAGARRTTVLLIGETGTGKELFARGI